VWYQKLQFHLFRQNASAPKGTTDNGIAGEFSPDKPYEDKQSKRTGSRTVEVEVEL